GVAGELAQVGFDGARRTGDEVGEDVVAELVAPAVEHRKGGQHAEHDDRQRHQREHRGVGQRAGGLEQVVAEEAGPEEAEKGREAMPVAQVPAPAVDRFQRFHAAKPNPAPVYGYSCRPWSRGEKVPRCPKSWSCTTAVAAPWHGLRDRSRGASKRSRAWSRGCAASRRSRP